MKAMVLKRINEPLVLMDLPLPAPGPGELLIKIRACAVCRTDLHVIDGELTEPKLPLVLGHEIVGRVEALGKSVTGFSLGDRVGVPWLGGTCRKCEFCLSGRENLCNEPVFTGYQRDGGYAEYTVADARYCFQVPDRYEDEKAAPLLCAGLIGWRSLKLAGDGMRVGLYGFGAAAHILIQILNRQNRQVFAFTKPGDKEGQAFALSLGASWVGGSDELPPVQLDAAIIFAPVGALVPAALRSVNKGGTVVCGGIHMSDIPSFSYQLLWHEREVRSVANLTRGDAQEFFAFVQNVPLQIRANRYPLVKANDALADLRAGRLQGAAVLLSELP